MPKRTYSSELQQLGGMSVLLGLMNLLWFHHPAIGWTALAVGGLCYAKLAWIKRKRPNA